MGTPTMFVAIAAALVCQCPVLSGIAAQSGGAGGEGEQRGRLLAQMTAFKTEVPQHGVDVILARPTDRSITVSVAAQFDAKAVVEYWTEQGATKIQTRPIVIAPGIVGTVELTDLIEGAEYRYRVGLTREGEAIPAWGDEFRFRTRQPAGTQKGFNFVIQADSHLDQGVEPRVYEQTLKNMLAAKPDFMIDLGDTFMTDKRGKDFKAALPQYNAQQYYFGLVAHSAPLFMVLGNHDGEKGTSGRDTQDIGPWSYTQRTSRFPPPLIDGNSGGDGMYSGATAMKGGVGSNYYAFEWGDALFIVLDPYWSTTDRIRGGAGGNRAASGRGQGDQGEKRPSGEPLKPSESSWTSTLGRVQYDWLTTTLEHTKAKYRFVFIHHLVGGMGGAESRGGVESSHFFEWGGKNADGTPGFAEHRSGWTMPIHELLAKHHVSAVFHGHDHLYVHGQRDGIHYQCVPQPGNLAGDTRSAVQYGYASGKVLGSPGHVRVTVAPQIATVEFIRTVAEGVQARRRRPSGDAGAISPPEKNGQIVDSYAVPAWVTPDSQK